MICLLGTGCVPGPNWAHILLIIFVNNPAILVVCIFVLEMRLELTEGHWPWPKGPQLDSGITDIGTRCSFIVIFLTLSVRCNGQARKGRMRCVIWATDEDGTQRWRGRE